MPRIVDRLIATVAPRMLGNDIIALTDDDAGRIGVDLRRVWESLTCATFTVVVTPAMTITSWLPSHWYASPGSKLSGTNAVDVRPASRQEEHKSEHTSLI